MSGASIHVASGSGCRPAIAVFELQRTGDAGGELGAQGMPGAGEQMVRGWGKALEWYAMVVKVAAELVEWIPAIVCRDPGRDVLPQPIGEWPKAIPGKKDFPGERGERGSQVCPTT